MEVTLWHHARKGTSRSGSQMSDWFSWSLGLCDQACIAPRILCCIADSFFRTMSCQLGQLVALLHSCQNRKAGKKIIQTLDPFCYYPKQHTVIMVNDSNFYACRWKIHYTVHQLRNPAIQELTEWSISVQGKTFFKLLWIRLLYSANTKWHVSYCSDYRQCIVNSFLMTV